MPYLPPFWLEAENGSIEILSGIFADRLAAIDRAHPSEAKAGARVTVTLDADAADARAALPRLLGHPA